MTTDRALEVMHWLEAARSSVESHRRDVDEADRLQPRTHALAEKAMALALAMDFQFLLDPDRLLLSIGYQAAEGTRDPNCYDLLASEARLASFVAIAKGDAPARHWFRLGRAVTPTHGGAALISWSGSMFEYLMPSLVMRGPAASLIEETNRLVVARQIDYGRRLGGPWGVSESAYNARDLEFTYQYSNFGVPGLGLKRGLADNAVIAPYATALAAMVAPQAAARNFERLVRIGALGRYGFYEAVDMTPSRVPEGETQAVVQAFMAHHQGMSIVAIADALLGGLMCERFHAEPMIQATELLLQERAPRDVVSNPPSVAETAASVRERAADAGGWRRASPWSATPDTQLLSNGRYTVMLTAAGSGYSAWRDIAITRWREDPTCDNWGSYVFLRDIHSDQVWSVGLQPTGAAGDDYAVVFNEDRAQISRRDGTLATTLEVVVSAEDDAEVRRVTVTNGGAADARDRGHLLCRAGAQPRRRRSGPPRLRQAVRGDRVSGGDRRAGRPPPPARTGRARDLGWRTWPWSTAKWWASASTRPTGPASSAAASASARPPRSSTGGRFPDRPARCSTRSSR